MRAGDSRPHRYPGCGPGERAGTAGRKLPHLPLSQSGNPRGLQKGLDLCETEKPDLLLATDPDCDRVGIAVPHAGSYLLLTGNEVGVLLTDYIASSRIELGTMPQNPIVVKTIVTTSMIDRLAETMVLRW